MNLPLPSWCSREDYDRLYDMNILYTYTAPSSFDILQRISIGPMLNEFLKNILNYGEHKVFIYAAHDTSIASFVRALELTNAPRYPDYGNAVILEKLRRRRDNQIFIKVRTFLFPSLSKVYLF